MSRTTARLVPKKFEGTKRGEVTQFSAGACARMRRYLRTSLSSYTFFVTLTYPAFYPSDGRTVKNHLRRFCQEVFRRRKRLGFFTKNDSIFWFLEFQARGAPHFHLFTTMAIEKDWLSSTWFRIVNSDDDKHLRAGTQIQAIRAGRGGVCAYAAKYAAKSNQKEVPKEYLNVGRFWGICGRRGTVEAATFVSQKTIESGEVSLLFDELKHLMRARVHEGSAKLLVKNEKCMLIAMEKGSLINRVWTILSRIRGKTILAGQERGYYHPYEDAELWEFNEDSGQVITIQG